MTDNAAESECGNDMKKLLFIYNPHAGKGKITDQLGRITEIFQAYGYLPALYATQGKGDGVWAGAALGEYYDHVVCCGGDGTLSETITGLYSHKQGGMSLGYIPAGTTNDFSRSLELPADDLLLAAEYSVAGYRQACDVGRVNGRRLFIYVAAFGAFTQTSYATPQPMKNVLGGTAYVLAGISSLTSLKKHHMKVIWDEGELEDDFIFGMVSNSVSVGGFQGVVQEEVILDDGLFEVLLVRSPKRLSDLNQIATALLGHKLNENCIAFQTSRIRFESEESVPWTLDGEFGGEHRKMEVENLPGFVTLLSGKREEEEEAKEPEEV